MLLKCKLHILHIQVVVFFDSTELTEVMLNLPTMGTIDQHQSFGPVVKSTIA